MSALDRLADQLRNSLDLGTKPFRTDTSIDEHIAKLNLHAQSGNQLSISNDLAQQAVSQFWELQRFETLKDARLVSFSLCVPNHSSGSCIMEDKQRLQAVLDDFTGIGQWIEDPLSYRRCYQGLIRSYFTYDSKIESASNVGRQNWKILREYLHDRSPNIVDTKTNPDWVTTTVNNQQLFSDDPCSLYAEALLHGDTSMVNHISGQLGILKASWFLRDLVLAQIKQATMLDHEQFTPRIKTLIRLLTDHPVLRDRGLIYLLDKYASADKPPIHEILRNTAVEWWGNPWLPSNKMNWGGVHQKAREMVSEWLKREFIEAFFSKLAQDGVGDKRRANFWLRYAKSMDNVQFALGAKALNSNDRDFILLRKKMNGLFTELKTSDTSNNAFVMTMGNLVAVEFGGTGNAFYGYDTNKSLPFNLSQAVVTTKNAKNSLKHSHRILWMQHQDGINGWDRWEDMFAATLLEEFNIAPISSTRQASRSKPPETTKPQPQPVNSLFSNRPQTSGSGNGAFSVSTLNAFTKDLGLKMDDRSANNGNIWVFTGKGNDYVNEVLTKWKFEYKPGKGWWR
jgi:hypothetical protein